MTKKREQVILVNSSGKRIGISEKMEAHQKGLLHRAFSIFIFNEAGEMLLQKRSFSKYHFAGLWSNACCSHPRPGEKILSSARRRLREEMNFETPLKIIDSVTYRFHDPESNLTEHEFDYILTGHFNGPIHFNPDEAEEIKWMPVPELRKKLTSEPEKYTPWLRLIFTSLAK